jgi:hypothetical protein
MAWIANRLEAKPVRKGLPGSFVRDEVGEEKTIEVFVVQAYILLVAPQRKLKEVREKQRIARRLDGFGFPPNNPCKAT